MDQETWKDVFRQQTDSGKYWKNLFKDEFDRHLFLDRSDAVYICKKAQADAYQNVIKKLQGTVDKSVIDNINGLIEALWKEDDSALGMYHDGKQL